MKHGAQRRDHRRDRCRASTSCPGGGRAAQHLRSGPVGRASAIGIGYLGLRLYREHRVALHGLGDRHRALLYGARRAGRVLLHGRAPRMWETGLGELAWFVLGRACRVRADGGLPPLAQLLSVGARRSAGVERRYDARRCLGDRGSGDARMSEHPPCSSSAARCPTSRASTCSATARGRVIYVGKAKSVRKRVASHFSKAQVPSSPGHAEMVASVEHIECVVVATEAEALLAEQSFIKQYRPRFNIRLRDDKSYPFIAISLDEDYPRVYFTRERHRAGARLLRPLLERQARARDARGAGQGLHVPLLHRRRAGAAQRQPVPGLLHQALRGALRRLRHPRGVPREHRRRDRLPLRALLRRSSATSRSGCARPRPTRSSSRRRSSATGCRRSARCWSAGA